MDILLAYFLYPGFVVVTLLTLVFGYVVVQRRPVFPPNWKRSLMTVDGFAAVLSIVLAVGASIYLPWPFNPVYTAVAGPLLMWAALEAAFLVPSLVAQTSGSALVVRGAARALQIGFAGRIVVWVVFGALYWANQRWDISLAPAYLLAWVGAVMALPAAIGIGMFRSDTALTGVMSTGLDISTVALMQIAADVRATVLIAAVATGLAPKSITNAPIRLAVVLAAALVTMFVLRFLVRNQPFTTLAAALRWCWWRALPPALVALVYLRIVMG
ncbi:MAG: hypothetical protein RLZZ297_2089 [Chloroflexota bacterium]